MNAIGTERCISIVKWDKHSTWVRLVKQVKIKSWCKILKGNK
jgi:hypothetical protein